MDKEKSSIAEAGSLIKAITAAQDTRRIREVEFGCEHMQRFLTAAADRAERLKNSYIDWQRDLLTNPLKVQTTKDPKDPKNAAVTTLLSTFLCLQCNAISSSKDREMHGQTKKHHMSIESRSGCLYCGLCDDFVYDPTFEKIRIEQSLPPSSNGRKRKLNALYPLGEEKDKFVLQNANLLSCMAGAPRGMFNLGQTCYMSVILQAMIHNPLMRNYFLSTRHETADCPLPNCIPCAMIVSFTDVLATEKIDGHAPLDLLFRSWKNNKDLAGYDQQDAHEYFQSLLDHLHRSVWCEEDVIPGNKACNCLYHQTFAGSIQSTVTCTNCRNVSTTEDPISDLSLDLRHHAKRKKTDPKSPPNVEAPLDLTTCLANYTTPEKLGADQYTCRSEKCGNTPQRAKKHITLKRLPPTMCIQLKRWEHRGKNAQKLDTKVNFPLQLDMTPYTARTHRKKQKALAQGLPSQGPYSPFTPRSPCWYELSTVVVHIGKLDGGHYICYCKRDGQWFKFNDSKVTLATEAQVLGAEAYLLFYILKNLGPLEEKSTDAEKPRVETEKPKTNGETEEVANEEE
ncbi:hypothetical protein MMC30_007499 [Trapelia coarctata]|nr:hypothetical protein [Trapelia coarctata]